MKDNPCIRFSHIGVDGQLVYKPKKVFDTDKEAIAYAKMVKCNECISYDSQTDCIQMS